MASSSQDEVFELVTGILRAEFELDSSKLVLDARVQEDLDLDSIDAVDLMARLEEETGLVVEDEELARIRTLADVVRVVRSGLDRAAAAG